MKLLFVGPLLDFSGFANASRRFLQLLLNDERLDVVCRPLRYDQLDSGQIFEEPLWMKPCLQKDLQNVDVAIQMTTCNIEAVPVPGIKNGLYTFFETDRLQPAWANKAQEFDFIIVPCRANVETLVKSGVTKPILVASPPCDFETYTKSRIPYEINNSSGRTVFYNICQLSYKKGIDILLRAYYAAFASDPDEVLLVLKTYINMHDRTQDFENIKQFINQIKARCRIPTQKFPPVLPIVETVSDDNIHSLHVRGDAYVCASRAEGWNMPVFDALSHGKTVISNNSGGMADFVTKDNSLIVGGTSTFFFDCPHSDPLLYTGIEQCFETSPVELALTMKHFHLLRKGDLNNSLNDQNKKEWESVLQRRRNASLLGHQFDYRSISKRVVDGILSIFGGINV